MAQSLAEVCKAPGLVDMPGQQETLEENGPEVAEQWKGPLRFPGDAGREKGFQKCCGSACGDGEGRCRCGSEGCVLLNVGEQACCSLQKAGR